MKILRTVGLLVLMVFPLIACVSAGQKHYNQGVEYASEGKFIEAREEFKESIKIDPKPLPNAASLSLKSMEDAMNLKRKKDAVMHQFKGIAFGIKGKAGRAISEYTKAIKIEPGYAGVYNDRARVYQTRRQYDRAISDYTKAIEIDSGFIIAYFNRGIAFGGKEQDDRAISDFTKVIEIDPSFTLAYYSRGNAFVKTEQYDQAISDFTKAIDIDPKYGSAYESRGYAYFLKEGAKTKACEDWKRACELGRCRNYDYAKVKGNCG